MRRSNRAKEKLGAAVRVGGQGNVWAALDLIDYEKRVEPAIEHLFGNTLICRYIYPSIHPITELSKVYVSITLTCAGT